MLPQLCFTMEDMQSGLCVYITPPLSPPHPPKEQQVFFSHCSYSCPVQLQSDWSTFYAVWYLLELIKTLNYMYCPWTEDTMISAYFGHDIGWERPVCIKVICNIVMWIKSNFWISKAADKMLMFTNSVSPGSLLHSFPNSLRMLLIQSCLFHP